MTWSSLASPQPGGIFPFYISAAFSFHCFMQIYDIENYDEKKSGLVTLSKWFDYDKQQIACAEK